MGRAPIAIGRSDLLSSLPEDQRSQDFRGSLEKGCVWRRCCEREGKPSYIKGDCKMSRSGRLGPCCTFSRLAWHWAARPDRTECQFAVYCCPTVYFVATNERLGLQVGISVGVTNSDQRPPFILLNPFHLCKCLNIRQTYPFMLYPESCQA